MKTCSVRWELEVRLNEEEVRLISDKSLTGKIRVYDGDKKVGDRDIEIGVGIINSHQMNVELETVPCNVYIDKVDRYLIKMSREGYKDLIENGSTGDRMYNNSGCKVLIYKDEAC